MRTEEVGVGDHPELGVVLHYAGLGVPLGPSLVAAASASGREKASLNSRNFLRRSATRTLAWESLNLRRDPPIGGGS
jgi:hypothetical protein